MNKRERKRVFTAWVLLLTLMPLMIVKSFHHHHCKSTFPEPLAQGYHAEHHHHSCASEDGCLICQFILSPFGEGEIFQIQVLLTSTPYEPALYLDKKSYRLAYSHGLRAPPVSAFTEELV